MPSSCLAPWRRSVTAAAAATATTAAAAVAAAATTTAAAATTVAAATAAAATVGAAATAAAAGTAATTVAATAAAAAEAAQQREQERQDRGTERQAEDAYRQALDRVASAQSCLDQAAIQLYLADLCRQEGRDEEAQSYLQQSLALSGVTPGGPFYLQQNQVYGWSASAGLIWKLNNQLHLGAAWSSKQDMSEFEWNTPTTPTSTGGKITLDMDAPQTFTLGLAWKPAPGLLIEGDIKRIWFSDVLGTLAFGRPAGYTGAVPAAMPFGWSNQTVYALGIQKDIGDKMQVRAGFNYGKSPIGPEDVNANMGSLAVVEKHLTLGISRKFSDKVTGSLSYVHAFKNSVSSNVAPFNTIELKQNLLNFQISYQY